MGALALAACTTASASSEPIAAGVGSTRHSRSSTTAGLETTPATKLATAVTSSAATTSETETGASCARVPKTTSVEVRPTVIQNGNGLTMAIIVWAAVAKVVAILSLGQVAPGAVEDPNPTFGTRQVEQLICDRPDMAGALLANKHIANWVVKQFDGATTGARVHWDIREPSSGRPAECWNRYEQYPALVRITAGKEYSGVDKLCFLVFELHNLQNEPRIQELNRMAQTGRITRDGYALEMTRLEFHTLIRVKKQFQRAPLNVEHPNVHGYHSWLIGLSDDFSRYWQDIQKGMYGDYDPQRYFQNYFDRVMLGTDR
jgi:hypothetical protein